MVKARKVASKKTARSTSGVGLARREAIRSLGFDGSTIFRPSGELVEKADSRTRRGENRPTAPSAANAAMEIALKTAFGIPMRSEQPERRSIEGFEGQQQSITKHFRQRTEIKGPQTTSGKGQVGASDNPGAVQSLPPVYPKRIPTKPKPKSAKQDAKASKAVEREKVTERKRLARLHAKKENAKNKQTKLFRKRAAVQDVAAARLAFNMKMKEVRASAAAQVSPFDDLLARWRRELTRVRRLEDVDPKAPILGSARARLEAIELEWERLRAIMPDHPEYFAWPTTDISEGVGELADVQWQPLGMLAYLGYHVGKGSDLSDAQRKRLLAHVYVMRLPPINDLAYMLAWGLPDTANRLRKMADALAAFVRNAKCRKSIQFDTAISHWESDLAYLKKTFYEERFDFPWPIV